MSYERDEAIRQQEATEAMIRMRQPRQSSPHPDPRDELVRELMAALKTAEDALRSFQYGNASEEFAERMADHAAEAIRRARCS
jgi:hypothetical protein